MNEWNGIESSWCITSLRKCILQARIAFNCPEFHFLSKASDSLVGSRLEAYEACPSIRKGMEWPQPGSTSQGFVLSERSQGKASTLCGAWGRGETSPCHPAMHDVRGFQIHTPVRGTHHHGVQIPACTHSRRSAPSPGTLALSAAVLRSVFMLGPTPIPTD